MRILQGKAADRYVRALERRGSQLDTIEPVVRKIVEDVRQNGDRALLKYACRFDGFKPGLSLRVSESELREAWKAAPKQLRSALRLAEKNIRRFAQWQKPKPWRRAREGAVVGQLVRPLDSAGCYVPGGRFPLVSTLLMTVIPAQVAGVKNIRVVSPRPSREVLAAAGMLGVEQFYRVGGAQAIAALAYGTETIASVDKIVGPGNRYVTVAKKLVAFDCAIDMLAGPTEGMIVSDNGEPAFLAADLLAQAEHDPETLVNLVTTSRKLAEEVSREVKNGGRGRPPLGENRIAAHSISSRGAILIARSKSEAFDWANRIAPEHITVEKHSLRLVQNAGSIFVGDYSAQAAGDYASGPNHVLPTAGAARFRGGLSVMDFVKLITVQDLSSRGLQRIAKSVVALAETEGLQAHADSIRVRCARA
ncbi:MAG TPA: histidinol dehydrogenase [Terriglobales bacterium]|jgi:histidinol dehydrogenase|nr:histidinol dehydrogenase [Terriglobales bacterium]